MKVSLLLFLLVCLLSSQLLFALSFGNLFSQKNDELYAAELERGKARVERIVPITSVGPLLKIKPPAQPAWDGKTVNFFLNNLCGSISYSPTGKIIAYAQEKNIPPPENALEFINAVFAIDDISHEDLCTTMGAIETITNEGATAALAGNFTNLHALMRSPKLSSEMKGNYDRMMGAVSFAMISIGTPRAVHTFNTMAAGCGSGYNQNINPDRYPADARAWVLAYPNRSVRQSMASAWLSAHQPDAADVVRLYIHQIQHIPSDDSFWTGGSSRVNGAEKKKREIKRMNYLADKHEKAYKRWIEDNKSKSLNSGAYDDN